jgi:hypothetical protein
MVDDEGWRFEAWRVCPGCNGRSAIPGHTKAEMFPTAPPCPCDRPGDPLRRPEQEHKVFATRAELIAFLRL